MTVKQLIKMLNNFGQNEIVYICDEKNNYQIDDVYFKNKVIIYIKSKETTIKNGRVISDGEEIGAQG